MTLEDAIKEIARANIDETNDWYSWRKINEKRLPDGIVLPQVNQYKKNVALKEQLNDKWQQAASHEERKELVKYYISTWGGIHGNADETMDGYARATPNNLIAMGSSGIASWSKALCVHDPKRYAIFDARVSASLNSLQIIRNTGNKRLFPVLISRNKTITKGIKLFKTEATKSKWDVAAEDSFYEEYLGYLYNVASSLEERLCVSVFTIEMLLFSKAEELVRKAFPNERF